MSAFRYQPRTAMTDRVRGFPSVEGDRLTWRLAAGKTRLWPHQTNTYISLPFISRRLRPRGISLYVIVPRVRVAALPGGVLSMPSNGEISKILGAFKSVCCDAEIVIGVG